MLAHAKLKMVDKVLEINKMADEEYKIAPS